MMIKSLFFLDRRGKSRRLGAVYGVYYYCCYSTSARRIRRMHGVPSDLIWRWTAGVAQTSWSGRGQGRCAKAFAHRQFLYLLYIYLPWSLR
ncbi:hypothetical protein BRADI_2g56671v3 [Brachypodium distachyon]|uniref:Uncharacterized protein n=1 Tax=Brachypodium distachyon TaxID=15368 RepID=A0A0Q3JEJ2_BRADI|nr:hypothetical protein BRADI_2g56671v3 [Brachypodium distachyon]